MRQIVNKLSTGLQSTCPSNGQVSTPQSWFESWFAFARRIGPIFWRIGYFSRIYSLQDYFLSGDKMASKKARPGQATKASKKDYSGGKYTFKSYNFIEIL